MAFTETEIPGLKLYVPLVFTDSRGAFYEAYNKNAFEAAGLFIDFVQDNHSVSGFGVIRGLHFQRPPHAQTKLVRVVEGAVIDTVVDLRRSSSTFGTVYQVELSAENGKQLLIPAGFAHGFSVITETAQVIYKCDKPYNRESEAGIIFSDPHLKIDWRMKAAGIIVSDKDRSLPEWHSFGDDFGFD
jgi:dTDP-4-dehydrorhamnose 3,5-epimerase